MDVALTGFKESIFTFLINPTAQPIKLTAGNNHSNADGEMAVTPLCGFLLCFEGMVKIYTHILVSFRGGTILSQII